MDTSLKTGICQCERSSNYNEDYRCEMCAEEIDEQEFLAAALEYREREASWMEEALSA